MNATMEKIQKLLRVFNFRGLRHLSGTPRILDGKNKGRVAAVVRKHCENKEGLLIENGLDGAGLSEEFRKAGFKNIISTGSLPCEMKKSRISENVVNKTEVERGYTNIFSRKNLTTHGSEVENLICEMLPHTPWTDKPVASIFSMVKSLRVTNSLPVFLIRKLGLISGLYTAGRVEWFLFLPPATARRLLCGDGKYPALFYNSSGAAVNALYDVTLCATLSSDDFEPEFPTGPYKKQVTVDGTVITRNTIPLVKLVPKKHLYNIIPQQEIWPFHLFLKQIFRKRHERIIPVMEKFVHGCGLRMIDMEFTMMCEVRQIKPAQFLDLYLNLLHWPEYEGSVLQSLLGDHTADIAVEDMDVDITEDQVGDLHEEHEVEYL